MNDLSRVFAFLSNASEKLAERDLSEETVKCLKLISKISKLAENAAKSPDKYRYRSELNYTQQLLDFIINKNESWRFEYCALHVDMALRLFIVDLPLFSACIDAGIPYNNICLLFPNHDNIAYEIDDAHVNRLVDSLSKLEEKVNVSTNRVSAPLVDLLVQFQNLDITFGKYARVEEGFKNLLEVLPLLKDSRLTYHFDRDYEPGEWRKIGALAAKHFEALRLHVDISLLLAFSRVLER